MAKVIGKRHHVHRAEGEVRQSQVLSTYGAGAMIDLLHDAVLVGGLDFWSASKSEIYEPRLRDDLAERFRRSGRRLRLDRAFLQPPLGDGREPRQDVGIQVLEFPRWFVCQNPRCRALLQSSGLERKGNAYRHRCDMGGPGRCVPVRFVSACRRGHLDEFPWISFVHGKEGVCSAPRLRLLEGSTGDFSEVLVACVCDARRPLREATVQAANPPCSGRRPWLGPEGGEECDEKMRLLVRTASNAYFSQVESALSIPELGLGVRDAVTKVWDVLGAVTRETLHAFRTIPAVKAAIGDYSDDEVLATVEAIKSDEAPPREPLRTAEYKQLVGQPQEKPGDIPSADEVFFARAINAGTRLPTGIAKIVLCKKLREVRVQVGFTRIESPTPTLQGEYDLGVSSAPLGLQTDWLPASEVLGEGIFIQLDEDAVHHWEQRPEVSARADELAAGYEQWRDSRTQHDQAPEFPGARLYLLHSLSHMLITALALECGYPASAIRERLYCAPHDSETPMAGILLMTGSSSSEGTLGGLVEQGRHLHRHFRRAFDIARLCSNDPVCSAHSPDGDLAERHLEGAACHGCLFVAECSCERFNGYLDRALVVPALGHEGRAFFEEPA